MYLFCTFPKSAAFFFYLTTCQCNWIISNFHQTPDADVTYGACSQQTQRFTRKTANKKYIKNKSKKMCGVCPQVNCLYLQNLYVLESLMVNIHRDYVLGIACEISIIIIEKHFFYLFYTLEF
jgi:hypothetical protein